MARRVCCESTTVGGKAAGRRRGTLMTRPLEPTEILNASHQRKAPAVAGAFEICRRGARRSVPRDDRAAPTIVDAHPRGLDRPVASCVGEGRIGRKRRQGAHASGHGAYALELRVQIFELRTPVGSKPVLCHVRCWLPHQADMPILPPDVRCWRRTGHAVQAGQLPSLTQSGRSKRVAFVSERDSLASRCEA